MKQKTKKKDQLKEKLLSKEEGDEEDQNENNSPDNQDVAQIANAKPYRSRQQKANFLSKTLFWWALPLVKQGNKTHLEQEHLEELADDQRSSHNYGKFQKNFKHHQEQKSGQPLIRTMLSTFRRRIIISFIVAFFDSCVVMSTPYLIKSVIEYSAEENQDYRQGIILISAVVLSRILLCLLDSHQYYLFTCLGYDLTNTVSVALLDKSLRYSLLSTDDYKVGSLVNMLQVDAQRLLQLCNYVSNMCFLPLQLAFGLYLMQDSIGISFLFGVAVMVIMGLVNYCIGRFSLKFQKLQMVEKDERMKITTEIFNAIKFIKANAWEEYFYDKLDAKRQIELSMMSKKYICGSLSIFSLWITPMLIINATFAGYVWLGNIMSPQRAFTVISIFSILQEPIRSIPMVINYFIETYVSVKRIEKYLLQKEINLKYISHDIHDESNQSFALKITNGNFYWRNPKEDEKTDQQAIESGKQTQQPTKKEENTESIMENGNEKQSFVPVEAAEQDSFLDAEQQQNLKNLRNQQRQINNNGSSIYENKESTLSSQMHSTIIHNQKIQDHNLPENERPLQQQQQSVVQNEINTDESKYILKNINITIPKGKLVAFIGDVGCGKSSLLYSVIGEMKYNEEKDQENMPKVEINGDISIVNQKPWIMNATVKENIVFGYPFDEKKYEECVHYACLQTDFKVLGDGDQTQIGEKGVNLSGGQKARISLARSLYSNSSILLLDDILSAVDVHVGKSIVSECLLKYRKHTTRVLATHALHYLKYMDYIYFMKDGKIILEGDYKMMSATSEFQEIYDKYMKDQFEKEEIMDLEENNIFDSEETIHTNNIDQHNADTKIKNTNNIDTQNHAANQQSTTESEEELIKCVKTKSKGSFTKQQLKEETHTKEATEVEVVVEDDNKDYLMLKEDRKKGNISWGVVKQYCKNNGGFWYILGVLFAMTMWQGLKMASSVWISFWTDDNEQSKNDFYLMIYSIFSISYGVFAYMRAVICLFGSLKEAKFIHRKIISSLIFAPLNEFFERVPIGRILNILSKDLQVIDQEIGYTIGGFFVASFILVGDTGLCVYTSSLYVLIPLALFILLCKLLQMYYMNAQREVVRLETLTRSPIISFFAETLNGLSSIRAYNQQIRFQQRHCKNIDENKKCQFSYIGMESWFKQNLTFLSLIVNASAISFCLFVNKQSPSITGLLLTFAFSMDQTVQSFIRCWNYLEKAFVSVERCHQFGEISTEKGYASYLEKREEYKKQIAHPLPPDQDQLHNWPQNGQINIENLFLKYRPNLPYVIKGITAEIRPCEKIGVVGRTGAGKSTITLSLLRIIEAHQGKIVIDGVDISKIRLDQLRHKITIILQDPQLFDGTLRDNIDPLQQFTDSEIIETLEKCQLQKLVQSEKGLKTYINEGGDNLSVGEKQLVCIARALLKKSKIVLIDEATANIDIQTDHLIQQTISTVFKDCTVLTIAHRLNTILNSDRILVLSQGNIEEFDSPQNLLKNPNSHFSSLYNESVKENKI